MFVPADDEDDPRIEQDFVVTVFAGRELRWNREIDCLFSGSHVFRCCALGRRSRCYSTRSGGDERDAVWRGESAAKLGH